MYIYDNVVILFSMWYVSSFEHAHGLKRYYDRRMARGQSTCCLFYSFCLISFLQFLLPFSRKLIAPSSISQSKEPPLKLSKNLNLNRKPNCNRLRSFLPKLLRLLVKEFYSVFAIGHPVKTQVGWMYSIIFCMKFVTSSQYGNFG